MQCAFWFPLQLLSETFLILRRTRRDSTARHGTCTQVFMHSARYSCRILIKINFLDRFWKSTEMSNFMRIRPLGAELFHADGQTDKSEKAKSRFSQYCARAYTSAPVAPFLFISVFNIATFQSPFCFPLSFPFLPSFFPFLFAFLLLFFFFSLTHYSLPYIYIYIYIYI
jgi:hypothetical protein